MVADAVIYHPAVSHYLKFVATTVGRDKTLRTIQYFSRFLAWYTLRTNHAQSTVNVFDNVKKNFGSVRKAMRLGKFVEHFKAAALAADSRDMDPVLRFLAVGRQLGYAVYLSLDAIAYFDQSGIWKLKEGARIQREAYRAWLAGLLCNIVAGVYTLYNQKVQMKQHEESADVEKAVELKKLVRYADTMGERRGTAWRLILDSAQNAARLQLLSDVCDATVPSAATGLVNFDEGIVGLAGTVSSLIGLTAQWEKTA